MGDLAHRPPGATPVVVMDAEWLVFCALKRTISANSSFKTGSFTSPEVAAGAVSPVNLRSRLPATLSAGGDTLRR